MDDLISRTWLLAEYDKRHKGPPGGARKLIEEAPPALGTNLAEVGTDLISRQALLDKFEPWLKVKDYNDGELNMLKAILYEIRFMRSAQPDTYWKEQCQSYEQTINKLRESLSAKSESFEWCTDCKEYDQEKHCCPRWNKVIKKTIDEMKPKIVHCGECRHYVFVDDRMDMFPIRGCSVTGFRDVDAGDFCSRAERRTE